MIGFSWPLQQAVFERLTGDPAVHALCGGRVTDEPWAAPVDGPAVVIGEETVTPWDTASDRGAEHVVVVSVLGPVHGFAALKQLAAAVCDALTAGLVLQRGRVVSTRMLAAKAHRAANGARRVDMRFRIVVEDDAGEDEVG